MHYLQRYTAPSPHLRRVLQRRINKSLAHHGGDPAEAQAMLDAAIERLIAAGAVDDVRWARARAEDLHRRGTSARGIRAKLGEKGLRGAIVDDAIARLGDESADPELEAATAYARQHRLGPFCLDPDERVERREKHLAALARRGFSYSVARRVVDAEEG